MLEIQKSLRANLDTTASCSKKTTTKNDANQIITLLWQMPCVYWRYLHHARLNGVVTECRKISTLFKTNFHRQCC